MQHEQGLPMPVLQLPPALTQLQISDHGNHGDAPQSVFSTAAQQEVAAEKVTLTTEEFYRLTARASLADILATSMWTAAPTWARWPRRPVADGRHLGGAPAPAWVEQVTRNVTNQALAEDLAHKRRVRQSNLLASFIVQSGLGPQFKEYKRQKKEQERAQIQAPELAAELAQQAADEEESSES